MGLFFSLMIDMRTPLAMPSLSSSDLRAEGGELSLKETLLLKRKSVVPFTASRSRQSRRPLIKSRQEFLPAFY